MKGTAQYTEQLIQCYSANIHHIKTKSEEKQHYSTWNTPHKEMHKIAPIKFRMIDPNVHTNSKQETTQDLS